MLLYRWTYLAELSQRLARSEILFTLSGPGRAQLTGILQSASALLGTKRASRVARRTSCRTRRSRMTSSKKPDPTCA
jgi:hypothetical protein